MSNDFRIETFIIPAMKTRDGTFNPELLDMRGAIQLIDETDWAKQVIDANIDPDLEPWADTLLRAVEGSNPTTVRRLSDQFNEGYREELRKALEALDSLDGHSEVASIFHKGDWIFITGGVHYGDPPTELYEPFRRLWASGLTDYLRRAALKKIKKGKK